MGIRKLGYYHWEGTLRSRWLCWLSITANGIRLGMKQKFCQALIFSGMSTALVGGVAFYLLKSVLDAADKVDQFKVQAVLFFTGLINQVSLPQFDAEGMLVPLWGLIMLKLCSMEVVWLVLILSRVGPGQIAGDLKSNALPIYFSKPVGGATYLAGKWLVNVVFALLVTLLPGVLAYAAGIMMTGHKVPLGLTVGLLGGLVLQSLTMAAVGSILVIGLSSLFRNEWFVTVAWIALALMTEVVQKILDMTLGPENAVGYLGAVSMWRNFNRLSYYFLGLNDLWDNEAAWKVAQNAAGTSALQDGVGYSAIVLGAMAAVALAVSIWTVRKFRVSIANA